MNVDLDVRFAELGDHRIKVADPEVDRQCVSLNGDAKAAEDNNQDSGMSLSSSLGARWTLTFDRQQTPPVRSHTTLGRRLLADE